jgi:hypothetical protein
MVLACLKNGTMHYVTSSPRERHDQARRQSSTTTIADFSRAVGRVALGITPKGGGQIAKVGHCRGSQDRTPAEEAAIIVFWRHALLPLDDCLYALQPYFAHRTIAQLTITQLTGSALRWCLQHHGIRACLMLQGEIRGKKGQ